MTTLYIVRHGETEWNVEGKLQGHSDSPLTQNGILQAQKLAQELRHINFDQVFTSDLLRAKRTAEIIALEKQLAIQTTKALREQYWGKYEGMKSSEYFQLFNQWKKMTREERHTFKLSEDMENHEEVVSRLIIFLREIAVAYSGKTILTVTHGGIMLRLLIHLGYWAYDTKERLGNTAYIKLESDGVDFFIKEVKGVKKRV